MIASENQLLSIDESYLSDLSDENESTISGGTFGLFSWLFGGLFGYGAAPSTNVTNVNNNYNTIYVNTSSDANNIVKK